MPRRKLKLRLKHVTVADENNGGATNSVNQSAKTPSSTSSTPTRTPTRRKSRNRRHEGPKVVKSPLLDELERMIDADQLTYPEWQCDVNDFHQLHAKYNPTSESSESSEHANTASDREQQAVLAEWILSSRLQGIKHKQQAFAGDRSHPHLKALDALVPHLTYPGWPRDYQAALQSHYRDDNDWNRQRAVFRLKQKQCVLGKGDRGHPRLVELDAVAATLTYPGHERDVKQCEELHFQYTDDYIGNNILAKQFQSLRNRQAHWDGNYKTGASKELENLRNQVTYPGCHDDVNAAMEAMLYPCTLVESSGHVMDYATALQNVRNKQSVLEQGDRTHPRLAALDEVVSQAPEFLIDNMFSPAAQNWQQLVRQLEDVHFRYSTADFIGNAIFEKLLHTLRKFQKRHSAPITGVSKRQQKSTPSTPYKDPKYSKSLPSSPESTTTATTSTTTASSCWSRSNECYDMDDHDCDSSI